MKALVNPKLKDLADSALDIHGVEGVQIECNATTLWINVNGICILRIGGVETLEIAGTEYEMRMPTLRPVEEDPETPDEEEGDEEEVQGPWQIREAKTPTISNVRNLRITHRYQNSDAALKFKPSGHKHVVQIWVELDNGSQEPRFYWDWEEYRWSSVVPEYKLDTANWEIRARRGLEDSDILKRFENQAAALLFVPSGAIHDKVEIWRLNPPGCKGITRATHRWDWLRKEWKKIPFGKKKVRR